MPSQDDHFRKILNKEIGIKFRTCDVVSKTGEATRKRWKKIADSYVKKSALFYDDANTIIEKLIAEKGSLKGSSKFLNSALSSQLRAVLKEFEN
tara:strand:+ start:5403 stop:5684 length:282 start_codon:yes stop_codon:yes gene_type:complete